MKVAESVKSAQLGNNIVKDNLIEVILMKIADEQWRGNQMRESA